MKRVALALVAIAAPAHADNTAAMAYDQATALEAQGKWAEACPLYEASYRADPQIGVLLHLAICHEQIGKTASAFAEFTDAADLAKARKDPREQTARDRANALAPKLAKLYIAPPSQKIDGLVVKRDGVEITALVGTNLPSDPGEHVIVASAPGRLEWTTKVTSVAGQSSAIDLPVLEKAPDAPEVKHEGKLRIVTHHGDAQITIDQTAMGNEAWSGVIKSGGHTLRVTAPGMRTFQQEVTVADNDDRTIDVPLEAEVVVAPPEDLPSYELGLGLASGVKLRHDNPAVIAYRAEAAFRLGRNVNFGAFVEYGSIDTNNACGFDMAGPTPVTQFDFGPRNQLNTCRYVMPGLQLYIHVLPKHAFDPYIGITPGFRFGFVDWTEYDGGIPTMRTSEVFPAVVGGVRAGLDYHPTSQFAAWEVGAWFEASITIYGKESPDHSGNGNGNGTGGQTFVSLLGGLRSTVQF